MHRRLWPLFLLFGLALGVSLGLIYTWLIDPVQYYDTPPDHLRADLNDEYILLICEAYAADHDWVAAERRLASLDDPDIAAAVLDVTERAIAGGRSVSTIRHLASMAAELGVSSPSLAYFLPTLPANPSPAVQPAVATFTPTAHPMPTVTMTPQPTPQPTDAPQPTLTPSLHYRFLAQQQICDQDRPDPLLQVIVTDSRGDGVSGERIVVSWSDHETSLFTGFKPELGGGYADLIIEPGISYAVRLAAGSETVSDIQTSSCTSGIGPQLLSIRVIFEEIRSSP